MKRYGYVCDYWDECGANAGIRKTEDGEYVLYSEAQAEVDAVRAKGMEWMDKCTEAQNALGDAQARIEALEWLVEVERFVRTGQWNPRQDAEIRSTWAAAKNMAGK